MNIGLIGVLGIVFVTLKLTENIDWSWWLVLLPFYACVVVWLVVIVVAFPYFYIQEIIKQKDKEGK